MDFVNPPLTSKQLKKRYYLNEMQIRYVAQIVKL